MSNKGEMLSLPTGRLEADQEASLPRNKGTRCRSCFLKLASLVFSVLLLPLGGQASSAEEVTTLIQFTNVWKYNDSGLDLGTAWRTNDYDDSAWPSGSGLLGYDSDTSAYTLHAPIGTPLAISSTTTTFYFRAVFDFDGPIDGLTLIATNLVDDGCAIYINGIHVGGVRTPNDYNATTVFPGPFTEGQLDTVTLTDLSSLRQGSNLIAVEVHQSSATSSDLMWGMKLISVRSPPPAASIEIINVTNHVWKYNASGMDIGTTWREATYDDESWSSGSGLFGLDGGYPYPFATPISGPASGGPLTVYYRTHFSWIGPLIEIHLLATNFIDDGAVYYLNGVEIFRFNMPDGEIGFYSLSSLANPGGEPTIIVTNLASASLMQGDNVLAVEVHQYAAFSSDHVFGLSLQAIPVRNFTLVVNVNGTGSVQIDPLQTDFPSGSVVTLAANPVQGYAFDSWSGDAAGTNNPLAITMTSNTVITANFVMASATLTLQTQGQGTMASLPDRPLYVVGETVTLTATPGRWHTFARWGDGITANPRVITISASNSYMAIFSPTTAVETLTFGGVSRTAPVGMPAILVGGRFIVSDTVTRLGPAPIELLTTFPNGTVLYTLDGSEPSFFSSLYFDPFVVRRTVTIRAVAWDANFANSMEADPVQVIIQPTYSLNTITAGGGSVTVAPASAIYLSNTVVTVVATPDPGWVFLQWLGDANGTNATSSVMMTRDRCVEAVFGTGLNTTTAAGGAVVAQPDADLYPYGTVVRLTALPQAGNAFALWGNAGGGTNNPLLHIITNDNRTVSAAFAPLGAGQRSLSALSDGFGMVTNRPRGNRFSAGASVTLTALPDAGQSFLDWSGDASGTQNPLTVTLNSSKVITAQFTKRPTLAVQPCSEPSLQDGFQFLISGEFGARYLVEKSGDGQAWLPLATVTNLFGVTQFNDSTATNVELRMYRAAPVTP